MKRYHFPIKYEHPERRYFVFTAAAAIGTAVAGLGATVGGALALSAPLTFGTSFALGAGTLAVGGFAASKLLGALVPGAPKQPGVPGLPKSPSLANSEALAKEETDKKRQAIARNKTNYTGPLGLTPLDKSGLNLKTLTGA